MIRDCKEQTHIGQTHDQNRVAILEGHPQVRPVGLGRIVPDAHALKNNYPLLPLSLIGSLRSPLLKNHTAYRDSSFGHDHSQVVTRSYMVEKNAWV